MSDNFNQPELPNYPTSDAVAVPAPNELMARGLIFALPAVLGGAALTIAIWRLGFIASITSFVLAAGAVYLYARGAGANPRKGLIPLVLLIVLGVVVSFFGVIASDAWDAYDKLGLSAYQGRWTFISDNVFRGEVISSYGKDMAMFGVFAVLGVFSTMRRLFAAG